MSRKSDFFCNGDKFSLFQNVNPNEVLAFIEKAKEISIYDLEKKSGINRNTLYYLLRHLEFLGLTKSRLKTNESNRRVRLVSINKKPSRKKLKDFIQGGEDGKTKVY